MSECKVLRACTDRACRQGLGVPVELINVLTEMVELRQDKLTAKGLGHQHDVVRHTAENK